jgi:proline dehydrogenase
MPVLSPPQFTESTLVMEQTHTPPPKTIFDAIPLGLVLTLAKPYLAGQSAEAAIGIAHKIYAEQKFCGTLDILGEDAPTPEHCEGYVDAYKHLFDAVHANQVKTTNPRERLTVSMKPSMFSTMAPQPGSESEKAQEDAFDRITRVVDYALKKDIQVTLEAEDHRWTNFQLEAYFALINAGYTNLGTVLQTRLFRTEADLKRFDERMRVRLVIGIYNEPQQIAHTDKRIMKDLVVQYAGHLLEKGVYAELATHDTKCIDTFYQYVAIPQRVPSTQFEHQMLQGVPRQNIQRTLRNGEHFSELQAKAATQDISYLQQLESTGVPVRMYLPFGTAKVSGAYCRRRLRENPNMITYGFKNFFGIH